MLDARTGDVRAMATAPGFNANAYGSVWKPLQRNRAVTDTYEPGSTFKLVTVAGALSQHLVTPSTSFVLPYSIHVADRIIHDAEPRGTETMTSPRSSRAPRTWARSRSPSGSGSTRSRAGSRASASGG